MAPSSMNSNKTVLPIGLHSQTYQRLVILTRFRIFKLTNLTARQVVPADTFQGIQVLKNENDYMEAVPSHGKETVYIEHLPETWDAERGKESLPYDSTLGPTASNNHKAGTLRDRLLNRKIFGIRSRWFILAAAALLVLILVLGIGLGVGLNSSGGFKAGALSGTKISLVAQPYMNGGGSDQSLVMYFQHRSGQIRWMGLDTDGKWTGGDSSTLVADDAKLGTPISAVSYTWDGEIFWRVFCKTHFDAMEFIFSRQLTYVIDINTANTLQETWSQTTRDTQWALGPLSSMNISPLNADAVGLTACWFGTTSGSNKDFQGSALTTDAKTVQIRLTYAEDETTFKIMQYRATTQIWTTEQVLSGLDGHASPACHNRQPGTVDYYLFVDKQSAVNVYWCVVIISKMFNLLTESDRRDNSGVGANTTEHPLNVWTNCK